MTLSAAEGPTSVPLLDETIPQNLARTVAAHGGRDALVSVEQGLRFTYAEFAEEVDLVARGLMGIGVDKGDRVGIWSPNYAEWVLVQYATARIGAVLVTINPAYRSSESEYVLNQSKTSVLVAVEAFLTSDYRSMIDEVWDRVPAERVVYLHTPGWDDLLSAGKEVSVEQLERRSAQLDPDDAINIQYTSGTTGFPKGATLSHRNILNNGLFIGAVAATGHTHAARTSQHLEQRAVHRRGLQVHRRGPGVHPGAVLPLLRDGAGQPGLHHPRLSDGDPSGRLQPRGHPARSRERALHQPLRGADDSRLV